MRSEQEQNDDYLSLNSRVQTSVRNRIWTERMADKIASDGKDRGGTESAGNTSIAAPTSEKPWEEVSPPSPGRFQSGDAGRNLEFVPVGWNFASVVAGLAGHPPVVAQNSEKHDITDTYRRHVLLVDDDPSTQAAVVNLLIGLGCESNESLVSDLGNRLSSQYMSRLGYSVQVVLDAINSGDASDRLFIASRLAPALSKIIEYSGVGELLQSATASVKEIPQWRGRADGKAIDFFVKHYGSKKELEERRYFADVLKAQDRKLYDALAAHQSRQGEGLEAIIPVRPVRPTETMSEKELSDSARRRAAQQREASRRYRERKRSPR